MEKADTLSGPVIKQPGRGLTVKVTSLIAVPQPGVVLLVTVSRSVTVPVPVTLTPVVAVVGERMLTFPELMLPLR